MILPYRAKNPPEHFPYVTLGLIVINVLVWAFTSENFLVIRSDALEQFGVTHNNLSLWRLTSAMFLHGSLMHIAGNMLFLWIFGAAVEGRLRPPKFLLLYFLAGYTGGLLSDFVLGAANPDVPSLGASGAIMGVAGAYMFMFPFSLICVAYGFRFRWGVSDWQARWVVLLYIGLDVLEALLFKGADGVGHFAHLGGFGTGLLVCAIVRAQRDSEEKSNAQATRAEMKDYSLLARHELEALLQTPTEDMKLVLAYCEKANMYGDNARPDQVLSYMNYYGPKLMASEDPNRIAHVLLGIPPGVGGMAPVFYLRLASRLESIASNELAVQVYRRIYDLAPQAPDTEMALYRMGQIMQNNFRNGPQAQAAYTELLRLFPNGQMALSARQALAQIQQQPGMNATQALAAPPPPAYTPPQAYTPRPAPYGTGPSGAASPPAYPQTPGYSQAQPTQAMPGYAPGQAYPTAQPMTSTQAMPGYAPGQTAQPTQQFPAPSQRPAAPGYAPSPAYPQGQPSPAAPAYAPPGQPTQAMPAAPYPGSAPAVPEIPALPASAPPPPTYAPPTPRPDRTQSF